jgi:uncharacterized protein (TIGR00369 family)
MEFPVHIPFVESLGFELERFADGEATLAFTPRAEHLNSWNVLHGGVSMTLLDVAMAHAARSPNTGGLPDPRGVVTVEMKTSFMRPGLGRLRAHAKLLHQSTTMAFCEGAVVDAEENLVAHATGTFKYLKKLPLGSRLLTGLNASD